METMYDRIVALCKSKGVAPTTLFREIGLSPSRFSALRRGDQKSMSQPNLEKLARALNTTSSYLVYGDNPDVFFVDLGENNFNMRPIIQALSDANLLALMNEITRELKERSEKTE